jgi:hypothetical protein
MRNRLAMVLSVVLAAGTSAQASLVAHYQMNSPTPLNNTITGDVDRPNMTDPGLTASPTFLAAGGVRGSGAYQFDGVNDYLGFASAGYTFFSAAVSPTDFTVSFWIKTTDSAFNATSAASTPSNPGYDGTPQVPVLGDTGGGVGFALGIDGGVAAWRHYTNTGWEQKNGLTLVTDGNGHFVTFVFHGAGTLDMYVDGNVDRLGITLNTGSNSAYLATSVGRSFAFNAVDNSDYAAASLDDIRVYNTALTQAQLRTELNIPEPASLALTAAAGLFLVRRRATR